MPKPKVPSKAKKVASEAKMLRVSELEALKAVMPPLYKTLAEAYGMGGGELNSYILETYLPGLAFKIARKSGLVSATSYYVTPIPPQEGTRFPKEHFERPDVQMLGNWLVTKAFSAEFYKLLEPAIATLRKNAEANAEATAASKWKTPTPAQRVQHFLEEQAWSKKRLISKMADSMGEYDDPDAAAKKQLRVITKEPEAPNVLKDYHSILCDVMKAHSVNCAELTPLDLVWRRPNITA
jgi:hypothetical protein